MRIRLLPLAAAALAGTLGACAFDAPAQRGPRDTFIIGIDVSGSFRATKNYEDAIVFAARYIYGHLNGLGGLAEPRALFVASVGGDAPGETQAFHPIHDLRGKSIPELEQSLREWFPPNDNLTDFNPFFSRAADLVKRQNLTLAPITIVLFTDGVPDLTTTGTARRVAADDPVRFKQLDVSDLEYLARNVTIRVLYPEPTVAVAWERHLPRNRVRLWTVDEVVMEGSRAQWHEPDPPESQDDFWKWVRDNVDFRVRRRLL